MLAAKNTYAVLKDSFCTFVSGTDAVKIVNNLTTNDIAKLPMDAGCESFVTNVRGWVVAHGLVARTEEGIFLLGQHPDPVAIRNHIDRYIIREDAKVVDLSQQRSMILLRNPGTIEEMSGSAPDPVRPAIASFELDGRSILRFVLPLAGGEEVWICDSDDIDGIRSDLEGCGIEACSEAEFELARIKAFWPTANREISEKTIPQELDRDERCVSFTKGCYLGQETIARLDARGQLQKKLALLAFDADVELSAGDLVTNAEREAGHITSYAKDDQRILALAMIRRGSFAVGTQLTCNGATASVIDPRES